jgi:hypothetical protein
MPDASTTSEKQDFAALSAVTAGPFIDCRNSASKRSRWLFVAVSREVGLPNFITQDT